MTNAEKARGLGQRVGEFRDGEWKMKIIERLRIKSSVALWRTVPLLILCLLALGAAIRLVAAPVPSQVQLVPQLSAVTSTTTPLAMTPTPQATSVREGGLVLRGRVYFYGNSLATGHASVGMPEVGIYLVHGANAPELIAVTDQNGMYASGWMPITVGEKVRVWAEYPDTAPSRIQGSSGTYVLVFIPLEEGPPARVLAEYDGDDFTRPYFSWTHGAGFEEREIDFMPNYATLR